MARFYKNAKFWLFVGGTAAGLFAKSKAARKLCVNTIAAGMQARDCAAEGLENLKEEAQDIYEDAKRKASACDETEEAEAETAPDEEA